MSARAKIALGFFLLTAAVYILTAPGRIDSIDGQFRYDVTQSLISVGEPVIRDPWLWGVPGLDDKLYSYYNAAPSLVAIPLVWAGGLTDDPLAERRRFLFSLTTAFFGAATAAVMLIFLTDLAVPLRKATLWTGVHSFATIAWPAATSVLDQVQHGFWVLLAAWLGFRAARGALSHAIPYGAGACIAGAVLINYQPHFTLLIAPLALIAWTASTAETARPRWQIAGLILLAAPMGLGWSFYYNEIRFGTPFYFDKLDIGVNQPPLFGSPIEGLIGLLVSPGKSIFLYSPVVLLALLGWNALRRRWPMVAWCAAAVMGVQLLFTSCLAFFHGDWCWGPRYLAVTLPLFGLAMAFGDYSAWRKPLATGLIGVGLVIQLLGLTTVHERYFFERGLPPFFWWPQQGFYLEHSPLLARPGEVWQILTEGVPDDTEQFSPTPHPRLRTYFIAGSNPSHMAPTWMRQFEVFYRFRPWTFWSLSVPRQDRPVPYLPSVALLLALGAGGGLLLRRGLLEPEAVP